MPRRLTLLALLLFPLALHADNWPGWRGPRGDGTSAETAVPLKWSATENLRWKTPIPGVGHSSPVVWGDHIFVTSCEELPGKPRTGNRLLLCIDRRKGNVLWQRTLLTAPLEEKHGLNSYASSTPATDGKHVWVTFLQNNDIQVFCYDFAGNKVWQRSPGTFFSKHGFCSSPVLYKDLLIVNADQDAVGYLVAFDKDTGDEKWRTDRPNQTRSYCVPVLAEAAGRTQLVLSGSKCVAGYDPATGKQLWILDGPTEQYVASLVYQDGLLFLTTGYPDYHLMGIRPDGTGNVTRTHVAWHHKKLPAKHASYVPSPIAHGHHFYVVSDLGVLSCLETRTGRVVYREQLGPHHSASPVSVGDHLFFTDDQGVTHVIQAGPEFREVAQNDIGENCYASPAVSNGEMFLRGVRHLYCIGSGK